MTDLRYSRYFLMATMALTLAATEIYLPAMPIMAVQLGVSEDSIQTSVTAYLAGLVISALIFGPLSDSVGRRRVLLIGYSIFLAASVGLCFSDSIGMILFFRLIQGTGAGVTSAISPAVIRDVFKGPESAKIVSQITMVIVLSPAIAPIFGGFITTTFGWQACFYFLTGLVLIVYLLCIRYFPETHPVEEHTPYRLSETLSKFGTALSRRSFRNLVLLHSLPSSALWCHLTVLPFILIQHMGVKTEHFGFYMAFVIFLHATTSFFVQRTIVRTGPEFMIRLSLGLFFTGGVTMISSAIWFPTSPFIAILSSLPFVISSPMCFPASMSLAIAEIDDMKGTGSSVIATVRQSFGATGTAVAAVIADNSLKPVGIYILFLSLVGMYTYYSEKRQTAAL